MVNEKQTPFKAEKCKELIIDFKKSKQRFNSISVDSEELELVDHERCKQWIYASAERLNISAKFSKLIIFDIFE